MFILWLTICYCIQRKAALQEAMRTFPADLKPQHNEEMTRLQKELRLPPVNTELWLSLPRIFYRQSARFELPLDRRELNSKPLMFQAFQT